MLLSAEEIITLVAAAPAAVAFAPSVETHACSNFLCALNQHKTNALGP